VLYFLLDHPVHFTYRTTLRGVAKAEGRSQSGHAAYLTDIFLVFLKHNDNGLNLTLCIIFI